MVVMVIFIVFVVFVVLVFSGDCDYDHGGGDNGGGCGRGWELSMRQASYRARGDDEVVLAIRVTGGVGVVGKGSRRQRLMQRSAYCWQRIRFRPEWGGVVPGRGRLHGRVTPVQHRCC